MPQKGFPPHFDSWVLNLFHLAKLVPNTLLPASI